MAHAHDREFSRSSLQNEVEVTSGDGVIRGILRDVSLKGLYVVCQGAFRETTVVAVCLDIDGTLGGDIMGRVTRADAEGMAIEVDELGVEGYQHLRQLVLLNSDRPDEAEREIASHLGLKRRNQQRK